MLIVEISWNHFAKVSLINKLFHVSKVLTSTTSFGNEMWFHEILISSSIDEQHFGAETSQRLNILLHCKNWTTIVVRFWNYASKNVHVNVLQLRREAAFVGKKWTRYNHSDNMFWNTALTFSIGFNNDWINFYKIIFSIETYFFQKYTGEGFQNTPTRDWTEIYHSG